MVLVFLYPEFRSKAVSRRFGNGFSVQVVASESNYGEVGLM